MTCALVDIGCHLQGAAWEWWANVGLINKVLIVGGLAGIILGSSLGLLRILRSVGGWPAVIGFVAIVFGLLLAILPKKPKPRPPKVADDFVGGEVTGRDATAPFEFGRKKRKKTRRTIFDLFPKKGARP